MAAVMQVQSVYILFSLPEIYAISRYRYKPVSPPARVESGHWRVVSCEAAITNRVMAMTGRILRISGTGYFAEMSLDHVAQAMWLISRFR